MSIEEKYNIRYFNNKRCYKYDLSNEIMVLQDTIPYLFEYNGIQIFEHAWNRLTVKLLEALDSINPIPVEQLLLLEYSWSKTPVFTREKRVNYSAFKDIYVNTNHTATHAGMNIQLLLETYGVDPKECNFYIRRHPSAEPPEAREYYRKETEIAFRKFLSQKGKSEKSIDITVGNFNVINKYLAQGSTGFDDFFLFDDYWYFTNYKIKTLDYVNAKYNGTKNQKATQKCLELLDEFYKHRDFYTCFYNLDISEEFRDTLIKEIEFLFKNLKSNIISTSKLYARMSMLHSEEMENLGELNNQSDFYTLVELLLSDDYYFQKPFISNDPDLSLENDDILMNYAFSLEEFSSKTIRDYANKMHLKPLHSFVDFMETCSEYYVQIDADKMVSKEHMDIDNNVLEKIKKELSYYLKSFGTIDTSNYADYSSLPSLSFAWNKYLLIGIVRTYFSDEFVVKSSGGSFKTAEYTVEEQ